MVRKDQGASQVLEVSEAQEENEDRLGAGVPEESKVLLAKQGQEGLLVPEVLLDPEVLKDLQAQRGAQVQFCWKLTAFSTTNLMP